MKREIPNPQSKLLESALVAGAGIGLPGAEPPPGMGAILLYVPLGEIVAKSPLDIQEDLGLPWYCDSGPGIWFDEQ